MPELTITGPTVVTVELSVRIPRRHGVGAVGGAYDQDLTLYDAIRTLRDIAEPSAGVCRQSAGST